MIMSMLVTFRGSYEGTMGLRGIDGESPESSASRAAGAYLHAARFL